MSAPSPIKGTIGSRIRVILGSSGKQWLLVLNKDDGTSAWQHTDWNAIPTKVANQLTNCKNKGRLIKQVDFGPTGAWFISGEKSDGSGAHSWWGNSSGSAEMKELAGTSLPLQVSFGSDIYGAETRVLISGRNGYSYTPNLPMNRLKTIQAKSKKIHKIRLFHHGNYFISDDEGCEWTSTMGEHLQNEIKKPPRDVRDVAMAGDGSWVVVRDNKYMISTGVDGRLKTVLQQFFSEQRQWNNRRAREIREARARAVEEAREQQEREEREEEERLERERIARETAERSAREVAERNAREIAEREERERVVNEMKAEHERKAKEALEAAASARVSSLEAVLEKRMREEAADIKSAERSLKKRKRSLKESLEEVPIARRARISLEIETSDPKSLCVVCQDEKPVMAVVPCGHLCLCERCADSCMARCGEMLCPLCRGVMKNTMRIYTST